MRDVLRTKPRHREPRHPKPVPCSQRTRNEVAKLINGEWGRDHGNFGADADANL